MAASYATIVKNDRNRSLRERVNLVKLLSSGTLAQSCDEYYYAIDLREMADRLAALADEMDRNDAFVALGLGFASDRV